MFPETLTVPLHMPPSLGCAEAGEEQRQTRKTGACPHDAEGLGQREGEKHWTNINTVHVMATKVTAMGRGRCTGVSLGRVAFLKSGI